MVIARALGLNDEEILLLGLSHRNLEALQEGRPIRLTSESHGASIPLGWTILIVAGEDEKSIVADLQGAGAISDETSVYALPRDGDLPRRPQ